MDQATPMTELHKDAAALRASFMRNKAILLRALRNAELPDSFLEGWQQKLDRMCSLAAPPTEIPAPMKKLFNVSVKYPKQPRDRSWSVFRYAVLAESVEHAEQRMRAEQVGHRQYIDIYAREVTDGIMGRDNYRSKDGEKFSRGEKPMSESPLFAE
jgi:hypothetical protein